MNQGVADKVRKHLGQGGEFDLESDECTECHKALADHGNGSHEFTPTVDSFHMNQLSIADEVELYSLFEKYRNELSSLKPSTFSKDDVITLSELCYKSIKDSPDFAGLEEHEKRSFVDINFLPIALGLFELNDLGASKLSSRDKEALIKVRKLRELNDREKTGSSQAEDGGTEKEAPN